MNFFRLRVLNTLLLFLIGVVLGFILKEKFYPAVPTAAKPAYVQPYTAPPAAAAAQEEDLSDEPYLAPDEDRARPAAEEPATPRQESPPEQALIEAEEEKPARKQAVLKGEEAAFFSEPGRFEGRDLEMDLQMITARKARPGWRLNLVYTGPGKKIDYLYVDDAGLLGDKPDLRIGFVYKVRFYCGKGQADSGNTLAAIAPTGAKADWATGLSAVE
ncbi:MAG: hypothetical protein A2X32_13450 [Elusimicrobia bacterium GWC2_64_44]|nr:MAG: hypothetical protein A2X32_13450 [Elusimicrobia bacterium GWC2_64_44]